MSYWEHDLAGRIHPKLKSLLTPDVSVQTTPTKNTGHIPGLPRIPTADEAPAVPALPKAPSIPKAEDEPFAQRDEELKEVKMAFSNDEVLKKIEAYVSGPIAPRPATPNLQDVEHMRREEVKQREDHGQGDVKSKDDGRLKQNRDKDHKRLVEEAVALEEDAGESDAGARHEESDKPVKEPYERARVDHRASLDGLVMDPLPNAPKLPSPSEAAPKLRTNVGPLGKGLTPPTPAGPMPQFGPEEKALRSHPVHGPYVNKALGPNPNPGALPAIRQKLQNLLNQTASAEERDELQRVASLVATMILKNM